MGGRAVPEVKSLTFITMRAFLPEYFSEDAYQAIRRRVPAEALAVLDDGERGTWVDEHHMQSLMRAIYEVGLRRDDEAYLAFARLLAAAGISRFLRVFLSLASERFVLRKIPVVWKRLRRNAGDVVAEAESSAIRLRYTGFPFFGDPVYRLLSIANCQALAFAATERFPPGRVLDHSNDTLTLVFDLGVSTP